MAPKLSAFGAIPAPVLFCFHAALGSVVVMVVMTMVVPACCERRASAHQDQKGEDDELLHVLKRSTIPIAPTCTL